MQRFLVGREGTEVPQDRVDRGGQSCWRDRNRTENVRSGRVHESGCAGMRRLASRVACDDGSRLKPNESESIGDLSQASRSHVMICRNALVACRNGYPWNALVVHRDR